MEASVQDCRQSSCFVHEYVLALIKPKALIMSLPRQDVQGTLDGWEHDGMEALVIASDEAASLELRVGTQYTLS